MIAFDKMNYCAIYGATYIIIMTSIVSDKIREVPRNTSAPFTRTHRNEHYA